MPSKHSRNPCLVVLPTLIYHVASTPRETPIVNYGLQGIGLSKASVDADLQNQLLRLERCVSTVAHELELEYTQGFAGPVQVVVYDLLGSMQLRTTMQPDAAGSHTVTLELPSLTTGTYILSLESDGSQVRRLFHVVR